MDLREIKPERFVIPLVAGAFARTTAAAMLAPVDVLKTRIQFSGTFKGSRRYDGIVDAAKLVWRHEGIRGFYRGLSTRVLYIMPAAAISFAFYEQFKYLLNKQRKGEASIHPLIPLAAGGLARVVGTAARTPFDIVRQRLQLQDTLLEARERSSGTFDQFRRIWKAEGLGGFFHGYAVTLMRDAPFAAIYFLSYEYSKIFQQYLFQREVLTSRHHLVAGAAAGSVSALCTAPFDIVKTRLQTQRLMGNVKYVGVVDAFRTIYREEGSLAFIRGLGPRLLILAPAASLTFTCYELYTKWARSYFPGLDL